MRFAERFLVALALISILMRLFGMKDGPTMELIAMPLLALYYIIFMPFLLRAVAPKDDGRRAWGKIIMGVLCGMAIAYSMISLMLYTLGWLPKADMLENCSILLGMLFVAGIIGRRGGAAPYYSGLLLRSGILLGVTLIISILPLPHIGSLSHGAF